MSRPTAKTVTLTDLFGKTYGANTSWAACTKSHEYNYANE